jgi:predicted transcriptional regulator
MPKDAHQRLEIARRRQMVADLYLQRLTQVAIAERLGISQATVCDDLKKIQAEWRNSAIRDFDKSRELELRTFDWLQRESGEAWERSKKPAQSAVIHGDGTSAPTRKTLKNQNGDPRFLEQIQRCIAARCALLGLNAPQRLEHSGPNGKPLAFTTVLAAADKQPTDPPPLERTGNVFDVDAELARIRAQGLRHES